MRVCSKRKNSESRDTLLMVHCCWMVEGVMKTKVGYKTPAQPPCLPNRDFEPQHSSTMHKADVLGHDFIMRSLAGYNANDVPTRQSLQTWKCASWQLGKSADARQGTFKEVATGNFHARILVKDCIIVLKVFRYNSLCVHGHNHCLNQSHSSNA